MDSDDKGKKKHNQDKPRRKKSKSRNTKASTSNNNKKNRQKKRETNWALPSLTAFDELLRDGYTIISNQKVVKKNGAGGLSNGDDVELSYSAFVWDCQTQQIVEVAGSDIAGPQGYVGPLKFCIGAGQTIVGLEQAVKHLKVGQSVR